MPARKKLARPVRIEIKRNDTVKVIAGRDKGKTGRVLSVDESRGRILVEHVGIVSATPGPTRPSRSRGASPSAKVPSRFPT